MHWWWEGVKFPGKKRYDGVQYGSTLLVLRGGGWVSIFREKKPVVPIIAPTRSDLGTLRWS